MKIQPRSSTSTYDWGPGHMRRWHGSAQEIGEHLETLIEANDGQLTPAIVVEDARDASSILHPNFEWDDQKAAEQHRQYTARKLIQGIVVIGVGEHIVDSDVRGFVSVKSETGDPYFTSTVHAIQHPDLRRQILEQAYRDLETWRRKYEHLEEFAKVIDAAKRIDIHELVKAVPA